MKSFYFFEIVCFIFCGLFVVNCIEKKVYRIDTKSKEEKDCHLKALDECLNKAYYLTHSLNQTNLISTERDFDNMCRAVIKVINCMDRYFDRCSHSGYRELYQMGKIQFYQSWEQMCSEGPTRENYFKHSFCIQKSVKDSDEYKSVCINRLQKAFDKSKKCQNIMDLVNIGCCAFNQWNQCINSLVFRNCGFDSKEAISSLIEKASGGESSEPQIRFYWFNKTNSIHKNIINI